MPDGIGRSFGDDTGGFVGNPGPARRKALGTGQGRTVSEAEVESRARLQRRVELLSQSFPELTSKPEFIFSLARSPADDSDMLDRAVGTMSAIELEAMKNDFTSMSWEQQVGEWSKMAPQRRAALEANGVTVGPKPEKSGWGRGLDMALGAAGKVMNMATGAPVLGQLLGAMDWAAEEVSRTQRPGALNDSSRRAIEQSGLSPEQLQNLGIDARNATSAPFDNFGAMSSMPMGPLPNPLAVLSPKDLYNGLRTWVSIGHEGDDDYLRDVQYQVYARLEDEFPGEGANLLKWSKAIAEGESYEEIAIAEGIGPDQMGQFIAKLHVQVNSDAARKAVSDLTGARVSPGRTMARGLWNDPDRNTDEGNAKYVSGLGDAAFQIAFDPTLATGTLSKARKATRWAMGASTSTARINRAQTLANLAHVVDHGEDATALLDHVKDLNPVLSKLGRGHEAALLAEGRAVLRPAEAVAEAFRTGDFKTLVRKYPGMMKSIPDMQKYHNHLKAAGLGGLDYPSQVFEFYKHVAAEKSVISTVDDAFRLNKASTVLFGTQKHNWFIPKTTQADKARMATKAWFVDKIDDLPKNPEAMEDLSAAAREAEEANSPGRLDAAERAQERLELEEIVENGSEEAAAEASKILQIRDAEEVALAEEAAAEFDEALGWRPRNKNIIQQFLTAAITPAPKHRYVKLAEDAAESIEEFDKFNRVISELSNMPRSVQDMRFNKFVAGNLAERHALVNQVLIDMASATGLAATEHGREMLARHIYKRNQAYGLADSVARANLRGGEEAGRLLIHHAVYEKQLAQAIGIPSVRDVVLATRKVNAWRNIIGGAREAPILEAFMNRIWKPGQILRFAFPLRAGADEMLQHIGRAGAAGWLNTAVLNKWAGVRDDTGKLLRDADGKIVKPPSAAFPIVRGPIRALSRVAGVADDQLQEAAFIRAAESKEWVDATPKVRQEMMGKFAADALAARRSPARSLRAFDDWIHNAAITGTKWYHETALSRAGIRRDEIAHKVQKMMPHYERRARAAQLAVTHPLYQQSQAEIGVATFNGIMNEQPSVFGKYVLADDPASASGYRAVRINTDRSTYRWVGHSDLTGFYMNYDSHIRGLAESPSTMAAMEELLHHVPQGALDQVVKDFSHWLDDDTDNPLAVLQLLHETMDDFYNEYGADTFDGLVAARQKEIADELELNGVEPEELDLDIILEQLTTWDPKHRLLATDQKLKRFKYTTDMRLIDDRAANATHAAVRRLDGASTLRSFVKANTMDGQTIARPIPKGHTRVYGVMIDRRSAQDLLDLLSDPEKATAFTEALANELGRANLRGHLDALYSEVPPGDWELETWMAGVKASLAQDGGSYIAAASSGASDPKMAEALRDAIASVMPPKLLKPTIGFLDHPDQAFSAGYGIEKVDRSVVRLAPYKAAEMEPIDPDNLVRMVQVQMPNGDLHTMTPAELNEHIKTAGLSRGYLVKERRFNSLVRFDGPKKQVLANKDAIRYDWDQGAKFIHGEGGDVAKTRALWHWDDAEDEELVDMLDEFFGDLGIDDDIRQLVSRQRARNFNGDIEHKDVLEDSGLWDDFTGLTKRAKSGGEREVVEIIRDPFTEAESKMMREALDRLGVDPAELQERLGDHETYKDFLTARETAHEALRPAGHRRGTVQSASAIDREEEALRVALDHVGLDDLGERVAQTRIQQGRLGPQDHRVLGEIIGSGVTEDALVQRSAQEMYQQVKRAFVGRQSGEVLSELVHPLRRGNYRTDALWSGKTSLEDLPTKAFGPSEILAKDMRLDRMYDRAFQGAFEPIISAISRTPMFLDHFSEALEQLSPIKDNLIQSALEAPAGAVLRKAGLDLEDVKIVHEQVMPHLKANKDWGEPGDAYTEYAKALQAGDPAEVSFWTDAIKHKWDEADIDAWAELSDAERAEIMERVPQLFGDDDVEALRRFHANQADATEMWVNRAMVRAQDMTAPYIDDHRIRSLMQEYVGPLFLPYWYVEEQFLRRFARGMVETPHMLRKGQLTMHGLRQVGIIQEDANGNEMFVIPGSEALMGTFATVAEAVTGNPAWQVMNQPLSMRTDFMLPGWNTEQSRMGFGPIVAMPTEFLARRYPEWEANRGRVFPGDMGSRAYWEYLVPSPAQQFYKAWTNEGGGTVEELASTQMSAIALLESTGHGLPENATAEEIDDYLADIRQVTRAQGILRFVSGQVNFTSVRPVDQQALYRKEFSDILSEGIPYEDALATFVERYPDNLGALVHTVFSTQNETGAQLPVFEGAYEFMQEHANLVESFPETSVWLMPEGDHEDEFDIRAYNEQIEMGLRTRRSPVEYITAIREKQASGTYYERRDKYESARVNAVDEKDKERVARLDEEWEIWKSGYMAQHPTFAQSFSPEASQRRQKVLDQMRWMTDPGTGVNAEQAAVLRPLVEGYWSFKMNYDSYAGESSKAARRIKAELLDDYFDEAWLYVQRNPRARPFFESVIRHELPDAVDQMYAKLQEGATA